MICIYHNRDLDGYSSGALVKYYNPDAVLIGFDYGLKLPKIEDGQEIIMVDVSIPLDEMIELANRSKKFTWIDHHVSAIKAYNEICLSDSDKFPDHFSSYLIEGLAACEITWHYFNSFMGKMPEAIRLLGAYDTWRKSGDWNSLILPFQFGMRQICNKPENFPIQLLEETTESFDLIASIVKSGESILEFQEQQNEFQCRKNAFEIDFKGYRAICLNGGGFNSEAFKSVYNEEKHDLMMPFQFNGLFWNFSIYTTKEIDCAAIAKTMGGGGHKKAAGFQLADISELINKI